MSREHFQPFSTIKLENDSFEGGIVPQNVATHVIFMGIYKGLVEFSTIILMQIGPVGPVGLNWPKFENRAGPGHIDLGIMKIGSGRAHLKIVGSGRVGPPGPLGPS